MFFFSSSFLFIGVWEGRNGARYEGDYYEDQRHGYGIWSNIKGVTLKGVFLHGLLEGEGEEINSNGHGGYIGTFLKGKYHGYGTLIGFQSPLDKYSGNFQHGKREGKGEQSYENGSRYIGNWFNDTYEGAGELYGCDQHFLNVYRGGFVNGIPHGHGSMRWNDQSGSRAMVSI